MQAIVSASEDRFNFESWTEFVQFADSRKLAKGSRNSSRMTDKPLWYGTKTFEDILPLANSGWPEGTEKVKELSAKLMDKVTSLVEHQSLQYDVTGNDFDIPMVLQGIPEHWFTMQSRIEQGQGNRVIHIVYNATASSGISAETITAKGAAVAALIESLEYAGIRVALNIIWRVRGYGSNTYTSNMSVPVKYAEQPLDIDRLAFALAHPGTLRRLMFAVCESSEYFVKECNSGYGSIQEPPVSEQGDLYIAASMYGEPQWTSEANTVAWILAELKKQGVHITGE